MHVVRQLRAGDSITLARDITSDSGGMQVILDGFYQTLLRSVDEDLPDVFEAIGWIDKISPHPRGNDSLRSHWAQVLSGVIRSCERQLCAGCNIDERILERGVSLVR